MSRRTHVNLVDLVKNFLTSILYLLANIGFDTAENKPFNFIFLAVPRDSIFTERSSPLAAFPRAGYLSK